MFGQQFVQSLDQMLRIILKAAWLNLLWLFFSLLGIVVAGIFPATVASLAIARKWIMKEEIQSIRKEFWQRYKMEFFKSNIIGWILTLFGGILWLNYHAIIQMGDALPIFVVFAYYFVIIVYTITLVWIFPILCNYHNEVFAYFKQAFIIGITKLPQTLFMCMLIFVILYISLALPTMLLFFTISLISVSVMYVSRGVFTKLELKEAV